MLIDSNILIYSLNEASPKHESAQAFLSSKTNNLIFAQQNIFETLRIITHQRFPNPFSVKKALQAIQAICAEEKIISPTLETPAIAYKLISKYKVKGAEIFDACLVATALGHEISTIATDNVKHLGKYKEIRVMNPF